MKPGGFFERLRAAGLVLALAALSFKAFLPPGFMLDAHPRGGVVVTLCGGDELVFNPATGTYEKHAPARTNQGEHCPYAAAAAPTIAPVAGTLIALTGAASIDARAPAPPAARGFDAAGPPLPARGPPLSA